MLSMFFMFKVKYNVELFTLIGMAQEHQSLSPSLLCIAVVAGMAQVLAELVQAGLVQVNPDLHWAERTS